MPTTPSLLLFRKTVHLGLTAQAINFAQSAFMGHRVSFSMPVDFMNEYFRWTRAAGEVRPTGRFVYDPANSGGLAGMPLFSTLLQRSFETAYTDLDGVAEGLNYSSTALDSTNDMKRDGGITNNTYKYTSTAAGVADSPAPGTHYSVNDLVMAFVLNKCFGSSAYDTWDVVYNLEDAFGMLSNQDLAIAIESSLNAEEDKATLLVSPTVAPANQLPGDDKGRVDEMFRSLLSIDPQRFYVGGKQIPGLFESNTDVDGSGNWCLGVGDKIEIPVRLYFRAPVTVLSVVDNVKNPSSATPDEVETVFIRGEDSATFGVSPTAVQVADADRGNVMSLRLQLLCSAPVMSDSTRSTAEVSGAAAPAPAVAVALNPIFYDGPNYQTQKAIAIVFANLGIAPNTDWLLAITDITSGSPGSALSVAGLSHSFANSVLELTYNPTAGVPAAITASVALTYNGPAPVSPAVAPTPPPAQTIKITISAPPA